MPFLDPPPEATPESPNLFYRFGEQFANIIPEIGSDLSSALFDLGFREPNQSPPEPFKNIFDVPAPKNWKEAGVDIGASLAKAIPLIAAGETAGEGIAELAAAGPRVTKVVKMASGFGLQGLTQSPRQGAEDAALGGAFGLTESLPTKYKAPLAALIGLGTGAEAYHESGSVIGATAQGIVNAALPFVLKGKKIEDVTPKSMPEITESSNTLKLANTILNPLQVVRQSGLFKSAEESAKIISGEIGPLQNPASSAAQKFLLEEDLSRQQGPIATLQPAASAKTPLPNPVVIDTKTYAFKEDMEVALGSSIQAVKDKAAIGTRDLNINPTRQLKMATVLHPDDSEMILKASKKLGLEYGGEAEGQLHFTNPTAESPTTFVVPVGSTMKDLRNKLESKPIATLQKVEPSPPSSLEKMGQPLARKSEEGYIPTVDIIAKAKAIVGDKKFAKISSERARGASSPGTEAIAIENAARKIVAEDMLSRGENVVARPESMLWKEINEGIAKPEEQKLNDTLSLLEQAGTLGEVEKQNAIKTKRSGKVLKRLKAEEGFITPEMAVGIGRYVAAPVTAGLVTGAMSDDDHRMKNAFLAAITVLGVAHFGPRIVQALKNHIPEVDATTGQPNTIVKGVKTLAENTVADIKDVSASRAAKRADETVTRWDKAARWLQKNWGFNLDEVRISDYAKGQANELTEVSERSMMQLARAKMTPDVKKVVDDFISGEFKGTTENFISKVGDENIAQQVILVRESNDAAIQIYADSLPPGKLKTQVLESKGKYLTTVYRIFHEGHIPTQQQIEAAARSLEEAGLGMDERLDIIHQYLHEANVTREMFKKGLMGYGEKFGKMLARKEELSPEFRALLGEYTDPIEKLAVTGQKLMTGARTSLFFNMVADGTKTNGLKFTYDGRELTILKENLNARLGITKDPKEIATLQSQLSDLRTFKRAPIDANLGRLSGKWVDVHVHDDLATYDSVVTTSATRIGQAITQTNNLFRYGHVALNPLQYARQVLNVPLLGMMARTTPKDWYGAAQILLKGGDELARLKRLNIVGADYIQGQFHQDMNQFVKGKLDKWIYSNIIGKGLRQWEQIFRGPDLTVRVAAFQRAEAKALQRGMSAVEAEKIGTDYANRYTMNYAAAPPGLVKARNYPFVNQFLTFSYESARIAYNLAEDAVGLGPEKRIDLGAAAILTSLASSPFIIQALSEVGMSDQDKQDWNRVKNLGPDYSRSNFRFFMGRDSNGNIRYVDYTPLIIHDKWTKMFRDAVAGDTEAFKADNPMFGWENTPLLNVVTKQISGRDYHTGQILNSLGGRLDAIRRDLAPSIFGAELDRWAEALTPNQEGGLGVTSARSGRSISIEGILFSYLTSIRAYTSNPDYMVQRAISAKQEEIRNSATEFQRINMSNAAQEVKEAAYQRFVNQQQKIFATLQKQLE